MSYRMPYRQIVTSNIEFTANDIRLEMGYSEGKVQGFRDAKVAYLYPVNRVYVCYETE